MVMATRFANDSWVRITSGKRAGQVGKVDSYNIYEDKYGVVLLGESLGMAMGASMLEAWVPREGELCEGNGAGNGALIRGPFLRMDMFGDVASAELDSLGEGRGYGQHVRRDSLRPVAANPAPTEAAEVNGAPSPLPETLPIGTEYRLQGDGSRWTLLEPTKITPRGDGYYASKRRSESGEQFPGSECCSRDYSPIPADWIDWSTYHAALAKAAGGQPSAEWQPRAGDLVRVLAWEFRDQPVEIMRLEGEDSDGRFVLAKLDPGRYHAHRYHCIKSETRIEPVTAEPTLEEKYPLTHAQRCLHCHDFLTAERVGRMHPDCLGLVERRARALLSESARSNRAALYAELREIGEPDPEQTDRRNAEIRAKRLAELEPWERVAMKRAERRVRVKAERSTHPESFPESAWEDAPWCDP